MARIQFSSCIFKDPFLPKAWLKCSINNHLNVQLIDPAIYVIITIVTISAPGDSETHLSLRSASVLQKGRSAICPRAVCVDESPEARERQLTCIAYGRWKVIL